VKVKKILKLATEKWKKYNKGVQMKKIILAGLVFANLHAKVVKEYVVTTPSHLVNKSGQITHVKNYHDGTRYNAAGATKHEQHKMERAEKKELKLVQKLEELDKKALDKKEKIRRDEEQDKREIDRKLHHKQESPIKKIGDIQVEKLKTKHKIEEHKI